MSNKIYPVPDRIQPGLDAASSRPDSASSRKYSASSRVDFSSSEEDSTSSRVDLPRDTAGQILNKPERTQGLPDSVREALQLIQTHERPYSFTTRRVWRVSPQLACTKYTPAGCWRRSSVVPGAGA